MARVYVAVGSNIDPEINIPAALRLLEESVRVDLISHFYETQPYDRPEQPAFANGVFLVFTNFTPRAFKFDVLRNIENRLGRVRTDDKCAPRTIDLDLIIYDDLIINEPDLIVPDPDISKRAFIAVPLCDLDPDLIIPGGCQSVRQIADNFKNVNMRRLDDLTDLLRLEL